jgi:aquaporin Z
MLRKFIVEAIGTFFLVLTVGQTMIQPAHSPTAALAPLAIGAVLMVMVYAGGHVSGAHYNPAVSLAVWMRGQCTSGELPVYVLAQLLAAVAATGAVTLFKQGIGPPAAPISIGPALLAEFLFTFALAYMVLNVATVGGTKGNSYYGLAIGFTVMVGAYAVGDVSGGAFNPAVAVGITLMHLSAPGCLWALLVGELLGAAAAAAVFAALDLGRDKPTTATPIDQTQLRAAATPQ